MNFHLLYFSLFFFCYLLILFIFSCFFTLYYIVISFCFVYNVIVICVYLFEAALSRSPVMMITLSAHPIGCAGAMSDPRRGGEVLASTDGAL